MEIDDTSEMIFAQVQYSAEYADVHADLVALIGSQFPDIQSGLQSDSWIWVMDGEHKVAIDTFSSIKHQVKSHTAGPHVLKVIDALRLKYEVQVFDKPFEMWG